MPPTVTSHWSQLIEGLQASSQDFYSQLEAAVDSPSLPDAKHTRVDWREGGMLSAKREYLRVQRKKVVFDICAAPYGNGFFISWWGGEFRPFIETLRERLTSLWLPG